MTQVAISVKNVSKKYSIGKQKDSSLRGSLAGIFAKKANKFDEFLALDNVSFDIQRGDVVGIIGKNGAGKSTLLKILSQITRPSAGEIEINGRVASLLEVGTGFHPELTGRENVFLNGTILGMTRKEVASKFDEIVAFSGVEKFIDTPVKHYSSGMYVRLAFAVAAHLEPEILIIDEVLAVGDAEFQKKCLGKMKDVAGEGRTVLFVSHQLGSIRQLCNKGILLNRGAVTLTGDIENVVSEYQKKGTESSSFVKNESSKDFFISKVEFKSDNTSFYASEAIELIVDLKYNAFVNAEKHLLLRVCDQENQIVGATEVVVVGDKLNYSYQIPANFLTKGHYSINFILYNPGVAQFDLVEECCNFEILDNNSLFSHLESFNIGNVYLPNNWK